MFPFGRNGRTKTTRKGSKNRDSGLFRKAPEAGFGQNFAPSVKSTDELKICLTPQPYGRSMKTPSSRHSTFQVFK